MPTCTQSEFAKLIGKDKGYVTRLKQAGRLVMVQTEAGERVDVEASQALLAGTADPAHGGLDAERGKGAGKAAHGTTYNDARTRNELAKAQTAELELAQRLGKVVDAEEARLFATDLGATFGAALDSLKHTLAPVLAPMKDPEEVLQALDENFNRVRTELADKILKWGKV